MFRRESHCATSAPDKDARCASPEVSDGKIVQQGRVAVSAAQIRVRKPFSKEWDQRQAEQRRMKCGDNDLPQLLESRLLSAACGILIDEKAERLRSPAPWTGLLLPNASGRCACLQGKVWK